MTMRSIAPSSTALFNLFLLQATTTSAFTSPFSRVRCFYITTSIAPRKGYVGHLFSRRPLQSQSHPYPRQLLSRSFRSHSSSKLPNYNMQSLSTTTLSMSAASSSISKHFGDATVMGGDHAGLSATFSPTTGELIPVPEHLVPQSMIEWGEIPSSLEILISEDFAVAEDEFVRTTITVLPEVGCGIDNLETTKKVDRYGEQDSRFSNFNHGGTQSQSQLHREVVSIDKKNISPIYNGKHMQRFEVETIFQSTPGIEVIDGGDDGKEQQQLNPRRIHLSFSVDLPVISTEDAPTSPAAPKIATPITLQVQRRYPPTSNTSTQGTAWTGTFSNSGGLDARTVMNFIGKDIVYGDVFAVKKGKNGGDQWNLDGVENVNESRDIFNILAGSWTQSFEHGDDLVQKEVQRTKTDFGGDNAAYNDDESNGVVTIRLPQNVMIRYGFGLCPPGMSGADTNLIDAWGVEVSSFDIVNAHLEGGIGSDGHARLQRRVLLRLFDNLAVDEEGNSNSESSGALGSIRYWTEEKSLD